MRVKLNEEMSKLEENRRRRWKTVLFCLQKLGESRLDELVLTVYDDVASHLIPWAKKTLLAHLIKLRRDGVIREEHGHWKIGPR